MNTLTFNNNVELEYEYIPIIGSATAFSDIKYCTKVYIKSGSSTYPLDWWDGKLDEDDIKARVAKTLEPKIEKKYGTQQPTRRQDLPPRRR